MKRGVLHPTMAQLKRHSVKFLVLYSQKSFDAESGLDTILERKRKKHQQHGQSIADIVLVEGVAADAASVLQAGS